MKQEFESLKVSLIILEEVFDSWHQWWSTVTAQPRIHFLFFSLTVSGDGQAASRNKSS